MQLNRGHSRETDRQADRQDTPPTCPLFLRCFNAVCISNYSQPHTLKLTHRIYCHTSLLCSALLSISLSHTHTHTIMTGNVKLIQEVHIYACEHAHTRRRAGDLNDSQLLYRSKGEHKCRWRINCSICHRNRALFVTLASLLVYVH